MAQAEHSAALAHRLARDILAEGFAQLQQVAAQLQQQHEAAAAAATPAAAPPPDLCSTGVQAEFSWPRLPQLAGTAEVVEQPAARDGPEADDVGSRAVAPPAAPARSRTPADYSDVFEEEYSEFAGDSYRAAVSASAALCSLHAAEYTLVEVYCSLAADQELSNTQGFPAQGCLATPDQLAPFSGGRRSMSGPF
jgi:hypothetical protein